MTTKTPLFLTAAALLFVLGTSVHGNIVKMDFAEDMEALDIFYDHLELNDYYETLEEVMGVYHSTQVGNIRRGIWVYKPAGPGSCCGGSLEFRFSNRENNLWQSGDKLEIEITYFSNKPMIIYPIPEVNGTVIQELPASEGGLLNWTMAAVTMNSTSSVVVFRTELAQYDGYFILDKINFLINE